MQLQGCVEVLTSLRDGEFGPCEKETEDYIAACREKFPYAKAFQPPAPPSDDEANHVEESQVKEVSASY